MATTSKKTPAKSKSKTTTKSKKPTTKKTTAKSKKPEAKSVSKVSSSSITKTTKNEKLTDTKTINKTDKKRPKTNMEQLRLWNFVIAFLNFIQAIALLFLANEKLYPVTTSFVTKDLIASTETDTVVVSAVRNLFDLNLVYLIILFFLISSIAHLSVATWYRKRYEASISFGLNRARWFMYGLSSSVVLLGIAIISGVSDISTLILVFATGMVASLCALIMEAHNQLTSRISWLGYKVGTIAYILPWLVVAIYLWGANAYGNDGLQNYTYLVTGFALLVSVSFAVNLYLQYKKTGRWSDYIFGEKFNMILSLLLNFVFAWMLYANLLS